MLDDKVCEYELCQRIFHPKRRWQKYCSPECRNAAFYGRQLESRDSLDNLDVDAAGPSEYQKAEWASRSKPDESEQRWENKALADRVWAELDRRDRLASPSNPLNKYAPEPVNVETTHHAPDDHMGQNEKGSPSKEAGETDNIKAVKDKM